MEYTLKTKAVKLNEAYEVIVCGGGPAGCAAAISAAREGAKTLLIETSGMLGGMATKGLVNAWTPIHDGERIIHAGLTLQIIKEVFLPAFDDLKDCLQMAAYIINKMKVNEHILDNPIYDNMFSVEEVNRLAREGMPFRDAYKKVGLDIEAGNFSPDKNIRHTHEGSIGNLCNDRIREKLQRVMQEFE